MLTDVLSFARHWCLRRSGHWSKRRQRPTVSRQSCRRQVFEVDLFPLPFAQVDMHSNQCPLCGWAGAEGSEGRGPATRGSTGTGTLGCFYSIPLFIIRASGQIPPRFRGQNQRLHNYHVVGFGDGQIEGISFLTPCACRRLPLKVLRRRERPRRKVRRPFGLHHVLEYRPYTSALLIIARGHPESHSRAHASHMSHSHG